jgi:hypothetical protein
MNLACLTCAMGVCSEQLKQLPKLSGCFDFSAFFGKVRRYMQVRDDGSSVPATAKLRLHTMMHAWM